ncbi:unnamed protein product [Prorocentrum cordatum]|uniref:Uncharacterized protein n=1 Tax=Prorocentrum cordatum TaxID=2364126 RepID=A0ABN9VWW3_9DINO|nr:unnamed protein product [Polarella glacialis]
MARVLAAMLMALAFVRAAALDTEESEDRPHGARRRARERALKSETDLDIAKTGCAQLGGDKWFADAHGELFQVKQDHCTITFGLKTKSGETVEKSGIVRGAKVFVEPPFPEGEVLGAAVRFANGAAWERKW